MSSFSRSIPRPKDWQEFERLSCILFKCILEDDRVQLHGRSGQDQSGVDIYGYRGGPGGPLVGVQCKGKDSALGGKVSEKELRREVEKARHFEPSLSEFFLITTGPDDTHIAKAARLLEREVRQSGWELSIGVWGWSTLELEISQHPKALKAFYPDSTPSSDEILDLARQANNYQDQQGEVLKRLSNQLNGIEHMLDERVQKPDRRDTDDAFDLLTPLAACAADGRKTAYSR